MAQASHGAATSFTHDNRALSTTAATISLPKQCVSILIHNVDASISDLVSFDSGSTFKAITAGSTLSLDVDGLRSFQIKSASGTPNVEMLFGSK